jgi:hypothetical protein
VVGNWAATVKTGAGAWGGGGVEWRINAGGGNSAEVRVRGFRRTHRRRL